jgi:hypothetical protein
LSPAAALAGPPGGVTPVQYQDTGTLYISIQSQEGRPEPPGELVLSDPSGDLAGYDPRYGRTYREIHGAAYTREELPGQADQEAAVLDLRQAVSGTYSLRVIGVEPGIYFLGMQGYDAAGNKADVSFSNAAIQPGEVHHYLIRYSNRDGASLKVRRTRSQ